MQSEVNVVVGLAELTFLLEVARAQGTNVARMVNTCCRSKKSNHGFRIDAHAIHPFQLAKSVHP